MTLSNPDIDRLDRVATALSKLTPDSFDKPVKTGLDRAMMFARGLAMTEMQGRGNGNDELGRPRRKPGAQRIWQTIRVLRAERHGDVWTAGLVAGSARVLHARIQELGGKTKPHLIVPRRRPKTGKLVFYWKRAGSVVFFKKVNHPGSKIPAKPYLRPSIERSKLTAQQEVSREVVVLIESKLTG